MTLTILCRAETDNRRFECMLEIRKAISAVFGSGMGAALLCELFNVQFDR